MTRDKPTKRNNLQLDVRRPVFAAREHPPQLLGRRIRGRNREQLNARNMQDGAERPAGVGTFGGELLQAPLLEKRYDVARRARRFILLRSER